MLAFLDSIVNSILFFIGHFIEMILFIPKMLMLFTESTSLVITGISFAPVFLAPILTLILAVAIVLWLVNLL